MLHRETLAEGYVGHGVNDQVAQERERSVDTADTNRKCLVARPSSLRRDGMLCFQIGVDVACG